MKLSILISNYNSGNQVLKILNSLNNVVGEFEVVIVDDGSTDDSLTQIKERIEYNLSFDVNLFSTNNLGSAHARNYALGKSKGEYILFVDSDDSLSKEAFIELVSRQDFGTLFDAKRFLYKTGSGVKVEDVSPTDFPGLLQQKGFWRYVYRKDFLMENKVSFLPNFTQAQGFYILDDWYFLVQFLSHKPRIVVSSEILYNYSDHDQDDFFQARYLRQIELEHNAYRTLRKHLEISHQIDYRFLRNALYERLHMICILLQKKPSLYSRFRLTQEFIWMQFKFFDSKSLLFVIKALSLIARTSLSEKRE